MAPKRSMWGDALRGGMAGLLATFLMDLVTEGLLARQSKDVTKHEEEARPNGKPAVDNLVDRIAAATGMSFDDRTRQTMSTSIHFGLGVVPGALYSVASRRLPLISAFHGLLYGAIVWAVNDEYLNTRLGLAAAFEDYPIETHVRGLVGHAVLGAATETGLQLLG